MKRSSRILRQMIFGLFLTVCIVFLNAQTVHAETKASKRVISVVYDDSGSMYGMSGQLYTKWAQANYALQAFASLLNEQDEMYITYMTTAVQDENTVYTMKVDDIETVDMNNIEKAVEKIRTKDNEVNGIIGGDTPVQSIDVAMEQLQSINDTDEMTQYWLVILTDGAMYASKNDERSSKAADLQGTLDAYKGTVMANGSSVYITYLGISSADGSGAVSLTADPSNQFDAETTADIVEPLARIANKVSGRSVFDASAVTQVDSKTVKVSSKLPLYSISVFSQKSTAKVSSADSLSVDRNISLKAPDSFVGTKSSRTYPTDENLYGNAAMITNGSNLIQSGEYTITFSEDVDLNNLVIMYQPAIEMRAYITRSGAQISDPSELKEGDVIDIEVLPVNPETGEILANDDLPDGITWSVSYQVDGNEEAHSDTNTLKNVTVMNGVTKVICTMQVPEFAPQTQTFDFSPEENIEYGVIVEQPTDFENGDASYYRSNMGRGGCLGEPVKFYITGNGKKLTKEEIQKKRLEITATEFEAIKAPEDANPLVKFILNLGFNEATPKLKLNDDGSFELYPDNSGMTYIFVKAGRYKVTVTMDDGSGLSEQGEFVVIARFSDSAILLRWIIAGLLLLYLILILTKKKFSRGTVYIDQYKSANDGLGGGIKMTTQGIEKSVGPFTGNWYNPFTRHSSVNIGGFRFHANDMGGVELRGSAVKSAKAYGPSAIDPVTNFDGLVSSLKDPKKVKNDDIISLRVYVLQGKALKKIYVK